MQLEHDAETNAVVQMSHKPVIRAVASRVVVVTIHENRCRLCWMACQITGKGSLAYLLDAIKIHMNIAGFVICCGFSILRCMHSALPSEKVQGNCELHLRDDCTFLK